MTRALGALALLFSLVVVGACDWSRSEDRHPEERLVKARSARAFGESVGVNVHLTNLDTSYNDFNTIHARLRELGVRHVRDGVCASCGFQIDRLNSLAATGIRANLIVGFLRGGSAEMQQSLAAIRDRLQGAVTSVEAPNEPDAEGSPDWIEQARAYQAELYERVKNDPRLARLPVIGPSPVHRASRAALGDLSAHLSHGNMHPYPGGTPPLANLADERRLAAQVSRNKPLFITEVGYHTDLARGDHLPASERAVQIYTPRIPLEAFRSGIERTYLYQLADPLPAEQARARGIPDFENSFGLLRSDLSRKPAFESLRNLLRTVQAGSKPVPEPGGLRFALEGAGPDVRQLLLRSADGTFALVLWRSVSVWDVAARRDVSPPPDDLEVVLGQPVTLAQLFEPVLSSGERRRWTEPRRIPVSLAGAPVVLRLATPS